MVTLPSLVREAWALAVSTPSKQAASKRGRIREVKKEDRSREEYTSCAGVAFAGRAAALFFAPLGVVVWQERSTSCFKVRAGKE
jgi:hypothetical protein